MCDGIGGEMEVFWLDGLGCEVLRCGLVDDWRCSLSCTN